MTVDVVVDVVVMDVVVVVESVTMVVLFVFWLISSPGTQLKRLKESLRCISRRDHLRRVGSDCSSRQCRCHCCGDLWRWKN